MKTLCLYYSRTNLTRVVMKRLAMLLDADVAEYTDGKDRSGFIGYIKSAIDAFKAAPEVIFADGEPDWDAYDTVIVGMPTWSEMPCVVGKGLLEQYGGKIKGDLYVVVTHMAPTDYEKQIQKLYGHTTADLKGHLSVRTKDHDPEKEIAAFARKIREGAKR